MLVAAVLAAAAAAAAAACRKPSAPLGPRPAPADSAARADSLRRAAELARARAEQDSLRALRERAEREQRDREQREAAVAADAMRVLAATVYFDYDQAALSDAARELLAAKVPVLQARPALRLRITGHTDDRGSAEYNLALGLRRAAMAKAFLVSNGIDASRIDITSMGEERPAVQGDTEEAWSKNRRDEFTPIGAGGDSMTDRGGSEAQQ